MQALVSLYCQQEGPFGEKINQGGRAECGLTKDKATWNVLKLLWTLEKRASQRGPVGLCSNFSTIPFAVEHLASNTFLLPFTLWNICWLCKHIPLLGMFSASYELTVNPTPALHTALTQNLSL